MAIPIERLTEGEKAYLRQILELAASLAAEEEAISRGLPSGEESEARKYLASLIRAIQGVIDYNVFLRNAFAAKDTRTVREIQQLQERMADLMTNLEKLAKLSTSEPLKAAHLVVHGHLISDIEALDKDIRSELEKIRHFSTETQRAA